MEAKLKAPFPWFGGKSRAASLIWERFGDARHYVEPFAGSLAVLLGRPTDPQIETVNDLDAFVSNFWRATATDPEAVAHHADFPVNEADLHSRHRWLVGQTEFRELMLTDPDHCDARIAGWWAWGLSCWIGGGWCSGVSSWTGQPFADGELAHPRKPHLTATKGVQRKRPGPQNTGGFSGVCTTEGEGLLQWFEALRARLRRVRICCGDWSRVVTPAVLGAGGGVTAVLLDPPYSGEERAAGIYAEDCGSVARSVADWARKNGSNPDLRIALCGYDGEHGMPEDWECVPWKASGGYGNQGGENRNRHRERIWFSPHCLRSNQVSIF